MFKLPKCKYCGEETKLEPIVAFLKKPSYAIVCQKCYKHQNLGIFRELLLIKFAKKK